MFYTFAPTRAGPVSKRPKVHRACEHCRRQRVRCDNNVPCSHCVANQIHCTVSSSTKKPRRSSARPILLASVGPGPVEAGRPDPTGRKYAEPTQPTAASTTNTTTTTITPTTPTTFPPTTSERHTTRQTVLAPYSPISSSRKLSDGATASKTPPPILPPRSHLGSITGFISRINSFCSAVSQMSTDDPPTFSDAPPSYASYTSPEVFSTHSVPCDSQSLPGLEQRLLSLYWNRLHWQMPIVSRRDLEQACSTRRAEPLCSSMMAYCLQSIYHCGLHQRLLDLPLESDGLDPEKGEKAAGGENRNTMLKISVNYFQRALACSGHLAVYAHPSLSSVQSNIMIVLFHLDAGEYQAAYNLLGLAIRIAQSLELHRELSSEMPAQEADLRRRVWWTLLHLDFQCSRYLGMEMAARPRDTSCALPSTSSTDCDAFQFHSAVLRLTRIAVEVAETMTKRQDELDEEESTQSIEAYAECLSHEVVQLHQWRDEVQRLPQYKDLILTCHHDKPDSPSVISSLVDEDSLYHQSATQIFQTMLLELQYHDIMIWVHRYYIQFPLRGLTPQRSARADMHATTALKHALTVIDLVRFRMCHSDALYGCCQIYQYVWNAALTLLGFTLAYPLCYWFPTARKNIELSLPIFDAAGADNPIASRAASLTRFLLKRVDSLIELLSPRQSTQGQDVMANTPSPVPMANSSITGPVSTLGSSSGTTPDPPLFDDLWSLADTVDPNVWLSYRNEVSDALMDLPDASVASGSQILSWDQF